jgi:ABC-type sugar transport system ATPase subunit
LLELKSISKNFGAVRALHKANLRLEPGEIRALLGANGSGKSTLVKIVSGLVRKDTGGILLDGKELSIRSAQDSRQHGIAAAYQDLSLVQRMTVAENIMLGHEPAKTLTLDGKRIREKTREYLDLLEIRTRPDSLVMDLDSPTRSLVEIAKALSWNPRILLLDEVTASLHRQQVQQVFRLLKKLRDTGAAILFVSHRLDEVFELCDTAAILRGGESVAVVKTGDVKENDLVYHMTGMQINEMPGTLHPIQEKKKEDLVLEVRNLKVGHKVNGVGLKAVKGEIIGIGGLQGQGQEEFLRALYGYIPPASGEVLIDGEPVRFKVPADAVRKGFGFIPGDREREGVFHARPIVDNIYMAEFGKRRITGHIGPRTILKGAMGIIEKLKIKVSSPQDPANSLSGGNQQKLVVGRWLKVHTRFLLLDDPTKGVDVTSRREIHELLRLMAANGTTIIISSSDNDELLNISDRILVFYEGKLAEELSGGSLKEERLVAAMLGVKRGEKELKG